MIRLVPTKWQLVSGRTNFVMEIQLGLWEGLFCMWFFEWWYLFWVSFFANICADFHWSPMVVTCDVILPPSCFRTESAWFPIRRCWKQLVVEGGWLGMTKMRVVVTPPRKQQTNALMPFCLCNSEKKGNQFWPQINEKPKQTYHVTQNKGFHKWTQRTYQTPNIWKHMAASKTSKNSYVCHPKTFNFLSPPKKQLTFPLLEISIVKL